MVGTGVIVYKNYMNVGLGVFKNGTVYGPGPKKNPLVPAHRTQAIQSTNSDR